MIRDFDVPLFNLFFHFTGGGGVRRTGSLSLAKMPLNVQRAWNSSHGGQATESYEIRDLQRLLLEKVP